MATTLTDQNIADTYLGLLHAQGTEIPTSTQVLLYDGNGNASSLKLGRAGVGATVLGTLSAESIAVNGIAYPSVDGTAGNLFITDGAGNVSMGALSDDSLPTLVPSPASTYGSISSITVDEKGRVTALVETAGGGGGGTATSQSFYVTPINLLDVTNSTTTNVNVDQTNKPTDSTYAILRIDIRSRDKRGGGSSAIVYINGILAGMSSTLGMNGGGYHGSDSHVGLWYAKIDGSDKISVDIQRNLLDDFQCTIDLMGFANFNTLSNP